MVSLPIIAEPFERIAMDVVGPLPRSRAGHRYVLVVCDYATWYPEAVAMRSVDAEHVAEELVRLFSRVGIPREILTDQGTNFTSELLAEMYRLLHIDGLRTSPYHPQTDGMVERFNGTLKGCCGNVLQKMERTGTVFYRTYSWPTGRPRKNRPDSRLSSYYTDGRFEDL